MILQAGEVFLTILYILIASVFLWFFLWLSTRLIVSKDFAKRKLLLLFLTAVIMVLIIPIITGAIVTVISLPGDLMVAIRELLGGGGRNYVGAMAPIIAFLFFLLVLKFLVGLEWRDTIWVALIGIFFLYLFYSLLPELDLMHSMSYT